MTTRTAVLVDDRDNRIGSTPVPEATFIIRHGDDLFVRTDKGVRLSGGGIGVVFLLTEPAVRGTLKPART